MSTMPIYTAPTATTPILSEIIQSELQRAGAQLEANWDQWSSNWTDWGNADHGNWGNDWRQATPPSAQNGTTPLSAFILD